MDFWYDRWLLKAPLADMVSIVDPPHMLVAEFYRDDGWNVELLKAWLPMVLVRQV